MKKLVALALAGLFALALSPAIAQTSSHMTSNSMVKHHAAMKHHMRKHHAMMKHHMMKHRAMAKPVVNPSGALNADKGATPNPANNANGVHTTAAPSPTPAP